MIRIRGTSVELRTECWCEWYENLPCTNKRLPAMQHWPWFKNKPICDCAMARSISASSMIMLALFPPSSKVTLFKFFLWHVRMISYLLVRGCVGENVCWWVGVLVKRCVGELVRGCVREKVCWWEGVLVRMCVGERLCWWEVYWWKGVLVRRWEGVLVKRWESVLVRGCVSEKVCWWESGVI